MGLDISYYRNLARVEVPRTDADESDDEQLQISNDRAFPDHAKPLVEGEHYRGEYVGGFRAGSYSGYSEWREWLAELAGYPCVNTDEAQERDGDDFYVTHLRSAFAWYHRDEAEALPFYWLVNFTDCDGVIGPEASARLAREFAAHQDKADAHPHEYFRQKYAEWRRAFEAAADNGAVVFH